MPQSLSAVYIHLIFSTKERYPYLKDEQLQRDLHAYLGGFASKVVSSHSPQPSGWG